MLPETQDEGNPSTSGDIPYVCAKPAAPGAVYGIKWAPVELS